MAEPSDALASLPPGGRRALPATARLEFFHGPMDCGKSTLALQIDHNQARQGRRGLILTRFDRSQRPRVTSRIGLSREAVDVSGEMDIRLLVRDVWSRGRRVDYLIVDEAQFLDPAQVEQLADLVDISHIDVYAFGLLTDFRSRLFPGSARLIELADRSHPMQVPVLCWCGRPGNFNGRIHDGVLLREGETVLVADTGGGALRYQVLCRRHFRSGDLGQAAGADQLVIDD